VVVVHACNPAMWEAEMEDSNLSQLRPKVSKTSSQVCATKLSVVISKAGYSGKSLN
jgi:hypothetical protein